MAGGRWRCGKRGFTVLFALAGLLLAAPSDIRTTAGNQPTGVPGNWTLTFDDEFNGTSLNRSTWTDAWYGSAGPVNSYENACYSRANVTQSGGTLNLPLIAAPCVGHNGHTFPYTGSLVNTDPRQTPVGFQQVYGFFEAKLYLPGADGQIYNWPAWWTNGQPIWPNNGEMDVVEGRFGRACWHFHSPSAPSGGCSPQDFTGWHIYGAYWQPGMVTYYYDGKAVRTVDSGVTSSPMFLLLDNSVHRGQTTVPDLMKVDYVRVWSANPAPLV